MLPDDSALLDRLDTIDVVIARFFFQLRDVFFMSSIPWLEDYENKVRKFLDDEEVVYLRELLHCCIFNIFAETLALTEEHKKLLYAELEYQTSS